ncbi:hypothetical protein HZC07_01865 [Candidatus Micrarchaeota archaeon]|nr:hypothetical protein [Candidatus Micrarchaeota archaeon]
MTDNKVCKICGGTSSTKWIERKNIAGQVANFCSKKCYEDYKKKGAETGVCEFC